MQRILKGTFLEEIIAIAQKGEFAGIADTAPKADDEILLGEATLLEKACRTFAFLGNEDVKKMLAAGLSVEDDNVQAILHRVTFAEKMFWALLRDRLGNNKSIRICEGWQIVEASKEKGNCDCPACQMMRQGISGGVMVIEVSSMPSGKGRGFLSSFFGR